MQKVKVLFNMTKKQKIQALEDKIEKVCDGDYSTNLVLFFAQVAWKSFVIMGYALRMKLLRLGE